MEAVIDFLAISQHPDVEPYFLTPQATSIQSIAEGYGARCVTVDSTEGFVTAFSDELERSGLGVIVVRIDAENNRDTHHRIWDAVHSMVESVQ